MFVCRACLRTLRTAGTTPVQTRLLGPLRNSPGLGILRRTYVGKSVQVDIEAALSELVRYEAEQKEEAEEEKKNEDKDEEDRGREKYAKKLEWVVKKHLNYLKDPWHIAQHVRKALDKGSYDEALLMARMASRNYGKVEVSWNHLIDYQMKNRRLHAAIKLYNEMKKRAQVPNAKTYTIIFRGCAESVHPKLAVAEATRIYNFMINYGALKPNTIHMNAVLEVCSRAGDMENLFNVLKTANEHIRAPDAHTYTIVLNALRHDAQKADKGLGLIDEEVKREIQKNIQKARAIWADAVARWRRGRVLIDEHLVCAMGRTLVAGDYHDKDSVLDLVEQTMKIPRFDKMSGKVVPQSKPEAAATEAAEGDKAAAETAEAAAEATAEGAAEKEEGTESQASEAEPVLSEEEAPSTSNLSPKARRELAASRADKSPLYAKPDCKTLSLVLTALAGTRKTSHAAKYWDYFTKTLGVRPDTDNYYCYVRALAVGHASGQMANLVAAMPADIVTAVTFRIAFGACVNDNLNRDAFSHACKIFDIMTTRLRYPDALAMRLFLHAARANVRHFHEQAEQGDPEGAKRAMGRQFVTAVDRMWEPYRILAGSLSYPEEATRSPEEEMRMKRGSMQEIMATGRRMISAMDRVINEEMAEPRIIKIMKARRGVLQRMIERYIVKLYPDGPKDYQPRDLPDEEPTRDMRAWASLEGMMSSGG